MPNILQSGGGSSFPEGVLDFLEKIAWGCHISGGAKFPVTPALFGSLTVDHANFWPLTFDRSDILPAKKSRYLN